jgi:competence protein ComEC
LTAALLTGDTSHLSDDNLRLLRRAGLAHLVVVSGLHLSIMALLLSRLLRRAPGVLRIGLVILFCWAFALLTGFGASVVRAAVMLTAHETAGLFSRRSDGPTALALAGILLVTGDLRMAGSVSFWLSFLSTAGILFLFVPLTGSTSRDSGNLSFKTRIFSGVKTGAAVSASAQLGALPVLATTFKTLSLMGIAANIPCVFLAMVMLPLGWLVLGISVWLPGMGMAAGYVLRLCAESILFFARLVSSFPFSSVGINERYNALGIWLLWLGGFALVVKQTQRRLGVDMMRRLAVCLLIPAVVSYPVFWLFSKNTAEVVFFPDFGAVAVQNEDRLVLLGAPSTLREASRMADVLEQLGMTDSEAVIILHGQYAEGPLEALVFRLGCDKVYVPDGLETDTLRHLTAPRFYPWPMPQTSLLRCLFNTRRIKSPCISQTRRC